jgi:hypothetical protein
VPYYNWTGSYFNKDLTAHDHEKRILTIGLENPKDYENLLIIHNGFSTHYVKRAMNGIGSCLSTVRAGAPDLSGVLPRQIFTWRGALGRG